MLGVDAPWCSSLRACNRSACSIVTHFSSRATDLSAVDQTQPSRCVPTGSQQDPDMLINMFVYETSLAISARRFSRWGAWSSKNPFVWRNNTSSGAPWDLEQCQNAKALKEGTKMTKMIKMENGLWPEFLVSVYSWNSARQNCPLWCFLSTCLFFCCVFSCEKYPFLRACQLSDWGERISRPQSVALPARRVNVARSSAHILPAGTTSANYGYYSRLTGTSRQYSAYLSTTLKTVEKHIRKIN